MLLSEVDSCRLSEWQYVTEDNSLSTVVLTPFWNQVAALVPDNVAPNVVSLVGFLCLAKAFYLAALHADTHPQLVTVAVVVLIFCHQTLDAIDGKHARRIRNASPLGELFESVCDNVGTVFLALTVCRLLGWWQPTTAWLAVQIALLLVINTHLFALRRGVVQFGALTGPGEGLIALNVVLAAAGWYGLDVIEETSRAVLLSHVAPWLNAFGWKTISPDAALAPQVLAAIHTALLVHVLVFTLVALPGSPATRNGMTISLVYVSVLPAIARATNLPNFGIGMDSFITVGVSGLLLAVLASDLVLCKMAKRPLHPWTVLVVLLSGFNNFAAVALAAAYLALLLFETADALALPLLTVCCNVYCDGIYDLCHQGHKAVFKAAVAFGTRLYAGVVSDADATPYKRRPIMTSAEREREVAGCKHVYKVIPNAPCSGLTEEFLRQHNIHIVVHGAEYDRPDDHYYRVPRMLGITRVLPRTDGISTSDLIKRIRTRDDL